MNPLRRIVIALSTVLCLLSTSGIGQAAEPTCAPPGAEDPAQAVRETYAALSAAYRDALPGPAGDKILARNIRRIIRQRLDLPAFTRRVTRSAWDKVDAPARTRWQEALGGMLERRYLRQLRDPRRARLDVLGSEIACDRAVVRARLSALRSKVISELVLTLAWADEGWRAMDVSVDEVSLALTWRGRIKRFYDNGGVEAVGRRMQVLAERYPPLPVP